MNEFSSQPTPGQSGSKSDTDIESDIDSDIYVLVNDSSSDSDHVSVASKHRLDVRKSEKAPHVERMSDQALINATILSQLDTIGKN